MVYDENVYNIFDQYCIPYCVKEKLTFCYKWKGVLLNDLIVISREKYL